MSNSPSHVLQYIEQRKRKGLFRKLNPDVPPIDFASNDYLGFSRDGLIEKKIKSSGWIFEHSGSTGSRLISGNSVFVEDLEKEIASFHNAESALIFNSGYDANLGLLSCVATKEDLFLFDELIHASIYDGMRLSVAKHYKFRHNDLEHLRELIDKNKSSVKNIFIVTESVYSMDGDSAPLAEIAKLTNDQIFLIVDEAHAIGVFGENGKGLCNELKVEEKCFARVYTFGKAMGCHGAAIVGRTVLRDYLVNYARSFIYTTALPPHSLLSIKAAYDLLKESDRITKLKENISTFNAIASKFFFIESNSPIHCRIFGNVENTEAAERNCRDHSFFVKAIKSPTVKEGTERLRISLHAYNTPEEIHKLLELLK